MKRVFILFIFLHFIVVLKAAEKRDTLYMRSWNVLPPVGLADSIPVDTFHLDFQDKNPIDRFSISNLYNGNLGSPIQSKIYFDRVEASPFLFSDAYFPYLTTPEKILYYNTKTPISNISYCGGLFQNYREENNIEFLFTANLNKRINIGTTLKYINSEGKYANQAASHFGGSLFFSYDGKRYGASSSVMINKIKNYESGGLVDVKDIDGVIDISALPVRLAKNQVDAYSSYRYNAFVYNHHYSLGFNREIVNPKDSLKDTEFIPVTRFGHTIKLSDYRKGYFERDANSNFYENIFLNDELTKDTAALQEISNTFSVSIEEKFNKWLKFGLNVFVTNDIQKYAVMKDFESVENAILHRTKLGGVLSKRESGYFKYDVKAELDVLGARLGDFNLDGKLYSFFKLWKDSVTIEANGFSQAETPSFFLEHYKSNHFEWENDFGKVFSNQVGGTISIPTRNFKLRAAVENISSAIYYNEKGMPTQHKGQVQILSAQLKQSFRVTKIYLENNVICQLSSNQNVVPLPTVALYHNLYYLDRWFKVLDVQAGVDLRYHTKYHAPSYMPATGRFYAQKEVRIGGYPMVNAYLNFKLKQARFFIKAYHLNNLFMKGEYLSMPNYPLNPMVIKSGISWSFYD